jgi:hypothetical protein
VSRFIFFLLLIANAIFGTHLWLASNAERTDFTTRERNRDDVRIVGVTPPTVAAKSAEETRRTLQSLAGAACVEFSGVTAADAQRAREAFGSLQLGDRMTERRIEEVTRHWVFIPAVRDRKVAEATIATLRKQGVGDTSIRPDNAISLGVFSTEEASRRFLTSLEAKGVKGAESAPFAKDLREVAMIVREPDTETVARLAVLQRDFPGTQLRAIPCPAP